MNNNKFRGSVQLTFLVSSPVVVESMVCVCACVGGWVGLFVDVWVGGWVCLWVCGCVGVHVVVWV